MVSEGSSCSNLDVRRESCLQEENCKFNFVVGFGDFVVASGIVNVIVHQHHGLVCCNLQYRSTELMY